MSVDTQNAVSLNGLTGTYVMALYIIKNLYKRLYRIQLCKATLGWAMSLRFHIRFVSSQKSN